MSKAGKCRQGARQMASPSRLRDSLARFAARPVPKDRATGKAAA
jgi:hypothetical protein